MGWDAPTSYVAPPTAGPGPALGLPESSTPSMSPTRTSRPRSTAAQRSASCPRRCAGTTQLSRATPVVQA
eukprot:16200493-Heterocapsa_arctica.AAC.1